MSFAWALHDANELLDGSLQQAADMIASGEMAIPSQPAQLAGSEPENDVLVMPLGAPGVTRPTGMASVAGTLSLGFHTVSWQGHTWRVLVGAVGPRRIAIAQRTEERDEIAQHSAMRTPNPLLLLIPVLVLLVREVVRRTLRPVAALAHFGDNNPMVAASGLPDADVPVEIALFLDSIGRLLENLEPQKPFVANAAHELRSPVAALHLQAANLQPTVAQEGRERLEPLQHGIDRMRHLLEQLLSMASSEAYIGGASPVHLADVARKSSPNWCSQRRPSG